MFILAIAAINIHGNPDTFSCYAIDDSKMTSCIIFENNLPNQKITFQCSNGQPSFWGHPFVDIIVFPNANLIQFYQTGEFSSCKIISVESFQKTPKVSQVDAAPKNAESKTYIEKCADGSDPWIWYDDVDGDGFGNPKTKIRSCSPPSKMVTDSSDCDDYNEKINPYANDILGNNVDDNCDGKIDWFNINE